MAVPALAIALSVFTLASVATCSVFAKAASTFCPTVLPSSVLPHAPSVRTAANDKATAKVGHRPNGDVTGLDEWIGVSKVRSSDINKLIVIHCLAIRALAPGGPLMQEANVANHLNADRQLMLKVP